MLFDCVHLVTTATMLLAAAEVVESTHSTCSWKPPAYPPNQKHEDWQPWCTATFQGGKDYICEKNAPHGAGDKVADWGKLAPHTLELATPCGSGGYAGHHDKIQNTCWAYWWLICKDVPVDSTQPPTDCYGLGDKDDCQWPADLTSPPTTLYVYWKYRPRAD